jgi:tetratricopeptide (TPR) repeat protein
MLKDQGAHLRKAGAILVFLTSLAVYLFTLAPTVTFVDSGELIVAAKVLGVAHPPGFPLYVFLTHLVTLIPIGNIAQRVNFASALFAAVAVCFLFLLSSEVLSSLKTDASKSPAKEKLKGGSAKRGSNKKRAQIQRNDANRNSELQSNALTILVPALIAALLLAFSRTLWSFATVAEVYTLNTMLIVTICFLMFRWRASGQDRFVFVAALMFGLGLGVHHVTVGVMLPALAVFVYRTAGWSFFRSKRLFDSALVAVTVTIVIYSYLPLAARRLPVMNWGDPQTLQRLWWHITGHQYQVFFSFSPEQIMSQASQFAALAAREFNPLWLPFPLILAALGFITLFRRDQTTFWFLALIVVADLAYSLNYEIAEDKGAYYLPTFISLAIAAGCGASLVMRQLSTKWPQPSAKVATAIVLVVLLPLITFSSNYPFTNHRNFYLAGDYIANIERSIPTNGMLLTSDWQVYSPLFYLREIEQVRRDVTAVDVNLLRRSWYFDYLKTQYPELMAGSQPAVEAFLKDLRSWEQNPDLFARSPALTRQINDHFHQMILAFVENHQHTAPVYVTNEVGVGTAEDKELSQALNQKYRLVPEGLVFRLGSEQDFGNSSQPELVTTGLNDGTFKFSSDDVVTVKVLSAYTIMMVNRGRYLEALGRTSEAIEAYRAALTLDPNSTMAREQLARLTNQTR